MPFAEQLYVNKERKVFVDENVWIKIFLTQSDFDKILNHEIISEDESEDWIRRCIVGKISLEMLEDERTKEIN